MTVGTNTYMGLAVPIAGESEIKQQTVGNDILTITGKTSQTGDFLVCRIAAGTEVFSVDVSGNVAIGGYLALGLKDGTAALTTATLPVTGAIGLCIVSSTPRIYTRQGTTISYANLT